MGGEIGKGYRRISKKNGADREKCKSETYEFILSSFRMIPEEMAKEVANYFLSNYDEYKDAINKLDDVFDLFMGTELADESYLNDNDWLFIKDLVNEFAGSEQIAFDVVSDVMTIIVDKGLM